MAAMQRFSVPHASPEIILSERKYSRGFLRAACRHCTRLWGRRSLSVSHTMPTVALPVGKCSAVLCLPRPLFLPAVRFMNGGAIEFTSQGSFLSGNACWHKLCGLQALHPIVGTAEPASFAHDADSRFASRQMLSRILPAARIFFPRYPIYISQ